MEATIPRDGSDIYSWPSGGVAVTGDPISSSAYNAFRADLLTDLNTPRAVAMGGTGASTASDARTNLGAMASDALLLAIAALTTASDRFLKFTGVDTVSVFDLFGTANVWGAANKFTAAIISKSNGDGVQFQKADGTPIWITGNRFDLVGNADDYIIYSNGTSAIALQVAYASGLVKIGKLQGRIAISSETSGALTVLSANTQVQCSGNVTLPSTGMTDGDVILIDPRGTARTITRPGAHTMYVLDTDSATATTSAQNIVTAMYHGSSKWTLQGAVS